MTTSHEINKLQKELLGVLMFGAKSDREVVKELETIIVREKDVFREQSRGCTHECYTCIQATRHSENVAKLDLIYKIIADR